MNGNPSKLKFTAICNGIKIKVWSCKAGSLSGDTDGIELSGSNGITSGDGFVPGYYRLTFDASQGVGKETLHIERLSD